MKRIRLSALYDTLAAAQYLLGKLLVVNTDEGHFSGIITETEAYLRDDPACHAAKGLTRRNRDMFLDKGHIYVYKIYGLHVCLNIVTAPAGVGEAVLIRSVIPVCGIGKMQRLRGVRDIGKLTSGPGNLTRAFGLKAEHSGRKLFDGLCSVYDTGCDGFHIAVSPRIGISKGKELPYRFYIADRPDFVSGPKQNGAVKN